MSDLGISKCYLEKNDVTVTTSVYAVQKYLEE